MEIKTCPSCGLVKTVDKFYFHHSSGKHEKNCKACKKLRQKKYTRQPARKSGVPHEQQLIEKIKSLGLYACSGKASQMHWVDIVVWSVAIEAKLARVRNNGKSYSFAFTPKQRQQGPRGDILIFITEPENSPIEYYLLRSDNPILFHGDGTRKREVYYTPNSTHKNADQDLMKEMAQAKDRWWLITDVIKEKSRALRNGTFQELFLEQTPPVRYKPSSHHKDKKYPQNTPNPVQIKRKPAQSIQMRLNSMIP